jgi:hypothetical protein
VVGIQTVHERVEDGVTEYRILLNCKMTDVEHVKS